jgi:hypothetical protein
MKLFERTKQIDFEQFNLNEKEREIVDYALVEMAIKSGDIYGVKDYLNTINLHIRLYMSSRWKSIS